MSDFVATEKSINNIENKINNISKLVDNYKRNIEPDELEEIEELEIELDDFEDIIEASIDELNTIYDENDFGVKLKVNQREDRESLIIALVNSGYKVSVEYTNDAFVIIEESSEKFY